MTLTDLQKRLLMARRNHDQAIADLKSVVARISKWQRRIRLIETRLVSDDVNRAVTMAKATIQVQHIKSRVKGASVRLLGGHLILVLLIPGLVATFACSSNPVGPSVPVVSVPAATGSCPVHTGDGPFITSYPPCVVTPAPVVVPVGPQ